ncbi:MAG: N-acetylglucosamine-6-phosphate deacetylase, partial [Spirosoma sp.]|nr:N-acetylglucosamine-6-phosphate deacetylase [Spirosoma sp.]
MTIIFTNAHLFTGTEWLPNASVRIANGRVQEINSA